MKRITLIAALTIAAAPAFAESHVTGDATAGEAAFARQCITCHVVVNEAGETLAGRKAKTGPNLYGVAGRAVASYPEYRYGKSVIAVGEAGHVWSEENFVAYVQDPTKWLRATLDDKKARSKMSFKVRSAEDAVNLYAYLAAIGPAMEMDATDPPVSN